LLSFGLLVFSSSLSSSFLFFLPPFLALSTPNETTNTKHNPTGTACYLLTVAIGTYAATALNLIIGAATASDPWVANNSLYGHYDYYFYVNAGILALALAIYIPVSARYVERPVADADADPFDREGAAHAELANVSRVWPSVSRQSRVSELRMRSQASMAGGAGPFGPGGGGGLPTSTRDARAAGDRLAAENAGAWERPAV
jgi:hypothetical protein